MYFFIKPAVKIVFFKYFFSSFMVIAPVLLAKSQENNPIDSLQRILPQLSDAEKVESLYSLSFMLADTDLDQAFYYDSLALDLARKSSDTVWMAKILIDLSYFHTLRFDYPNAKILLDRTISLCKRKGLREELYIAYTDLGNYFFSLNLYDSALFYHHKSRKIKEELGNKSNIAVTLNNIGMIYYRMGNYENALKYFQNSLELNIASGDTLSAGVNHTNIGLIYTTVEEFTLAEKHFLKSIAQLGNKDEFRLAYAFNGLGWVYVNLNDVENAKKYLFSSIDISKRAGDIRLEALNYYYLAELELNNERYKSAREYIEKCQKINAEVGDKLTMSYNFLLLAELYEAQNQYDSAYYYHKQSSAIENDIFNEQLINNLTNLQLLRQAEESQQIIAQKEQDITQRTKLSRMLAIVLILSVLLIIIVTRNYVQTSRINKKLSASNAKIEKQKQDLEKKNKQLADAQGTIEIQNERLRNVNSELEDAVKSRTKELEKSKIKLEKAVKDLDDFIYRTSHDLRGPIATMQGIIKVGTMESRDEETLKYFETLQTISSRANRILNKLIEVHEMYQKAPALEMLNVERCVKSAIELAGKSELANGIRISYEIDKNVEWLCDNSLLVTLIENMMVNAFLFSVNKESFVKLKVFKNPTSHLKLRFEDNGYGILESDVNKVFDVFFKGSPRRSGTGLEIYAARIAVEKLKGSIELKKPKDNTVYEITLPLL